MSKKNILAIIGSASPNSRNHKLVERISILTSEVFDITLMSDLKILPHFDPEQSLSDPPAPVRNFRNAIDQADGVIVCTPEYIFSIPSGLKNALEWCVATTVWNDKPGGIITASANGEKGHQELQLLLQTLSARLNEEACLLIQGVKGKINDQGMITDPATEEGLTNFIRAFTRLVGGG